MEHAGYMERQTTHRCQKLITHLNVWKNKAGRVHHIRMSHFVMR